MTQLSRLDPAASAITVSELNRQVRNLLERGIARLWVDGEISNLACPASGHIYFSLKDESAQVRCAWFRQRQRGPALAVKNGERVLVFGRVSLYEPRGDYQLIVDQVEAAGEGALRRQFEALKRKLHAAGLFDVGRKRELPKVPRRIGIVTSPTGAAIRDILTVTRRRFPCIPVVIYPTPVQGAAAVPGIVAAIEAASRRRECDVLIIARGGGSLEDLWAFNEEAVAHAIHDCAIPIISGVGHEVDVTIADFVADVRAPTPSGAAEMVAPDMLEWQRRFTAIARRLAMQIRRHLDNDAQALDWLARRLHQCSPRATLTLQSARLGELRRNLRVAMGHDLTRRGRRLDRLEGAFRACAPLGRVQAGLRRTERLAERLDAAILKTLDQRSAKLRFASRSLAAVSPLATLERGYAIVSEAGTGRVLRDAGEVRPGAAVEARLARGGLRATVTDTKPASDGGRSS